MGMLMVLVVGGGSSRAATVVRVVVGSNKKEVRLWVVVVLVKFTEKPDKKQEKDNETHTYTPNIYPYVMLRRTGVTIGSGSHSCGSI